MSAHAQHRGFTLVELLIVLVIIGILGTTIMLSSGSAVSSARALTIINNLRSLKEAALLFYLDSPDAAPTLEGLKTYIDNPANITNANYEIQTNNNQHFIGYVLTKEPNKTDVMSRLASRASAAGLLNGTDTSTAYTNSETVYIKLY